MVKYLPAMQETRVQSLGPKDLENRMAIHSGNLAWRIPWTAEPGRLLSVGSQRVGHDWVTNTHTHTPLRAGFPTHIGTDTHTHTHTHTPLRHTHTLTHPPCLQQGSLSYRKKAQMAVTLYNHWRAGEAKECKEDQPWKQTTLCSRMKVDSSNDLQNVATFKNREAVCIQWPAC